MKSYTNVAAALRDTFLQPHISDNFPLDATLLQLCNLYATSKLDFIKSCSNVALTFPINVAATLRATVLQPHITDNFPGCNVAVTFATSVQCCWNVAYRFFFSD